MTKPSAEAPFPRAAASAAIFRGTDVLLIQRGKGALKGYWSLPGGHIEPGERAQAAALREVGEETRVKAEIRAFVDLHEVILNGAGGVSLGHYVIAVYAGVWLSGDPVAAEDAADARFVAPEAIATLRLTDGAGRLIARARRLVGEAAERD